MSDYEHVYKASRRIALCDAIIAITGESFDIETKMKLINIIEKMKPEVEND